MGLFTGPFTDAERRAWQQRAYRALGDLLKLDLPPLTWQVSDGLMLVGRAQQVYSAERRAAWQAWTDKLGAKPWPERKGDGVTYLHSVVERYGGNTIVKLAILADVFEDD